MSDKDINIHVRARETEQTNRQLKETGGHVEQIGQKAEKAGNQGRDAMGRFVRQGDEADKKMNVLSGTMGKLEEKVKNFFLAWMGGKAAMAVLDMFITKLDTISRKMQEFYDRSISLQQIGQSLEFQTGTTGQQNQWARTALAIQKAGGIGNVGTAGQMMVAADIAFGGTGGIRNAQNIELLKSIAPFVGSAQLTGEEVTKLFEFAQTAGVAPNQNAWQQYLSQLQAGFTKSKATSFGAFMVGLQKGATPYIASGGSFTEAVSLFSGARSVTANEALAGTLLEQITRLSGGAYEKPRLAMEQHFGVSWSDLTTDQRGAALLQYAQSLPDSQRSQFLAEAGFAPELINQLGRLVTPGGLQTISATRQAVSAAGPAALQAQTSAYLQSNLAKQQQVTARADEIALQTGPGMAGWARTRKLAMDRFEQSLVEGTDRPVNDAYEPFLLILEENLAQLESMGPLTGDAEKRRQELIGRSQKWINDVRYTENFAEYPITTTVGAAAARLGYGKYYEGKVRNIYQQSQELIGGSTVINNNNNVIYNIPERSAVPRSDPNDLN